MTAPTPEPSTDLAPVEPLVSLRYILSDLRRRRHVWVLTALLGLLIGAGFHHVVPRTYQASTLLYLSHTPNEDPTTAMSTDVDLAATRPVAEHAAAALHLHGPSTQLAKKYTVIALTPALLKLTAVGPSYQVALARANALANAFLTYRAGELQLQTDQVVKALGTQMQSLQTAVNTLTDEINSGTSPKGSPSLTSAVGLQTQDEAQLTQLQATQQSTKVITSTIIGGSNVIDPAARIAQSPTKLTFLNALSGLIAGLGLGILLVVIPCLMSDRLRSRYDVARALDTAVSLSVPFRRRLSWHRKRDVVKVADHLYREVAGSAAPVTRLAVVSLDNAKFCAKVLDRLSERLAAAERRVLVADLTDEGLLARRHGVGSSGGIETTSSVVWPTDPVARTPGHAPAPMGAVAVGRPSEGAVSTGPFEVDGPHVDLDSNWRKAAAEADVVLTLAELDPAQGAEHLAGWSKEAIVVVTAGRSSGVKIQSTGNMIRHAGLPLRSAVLLDADPRDDTSGILHAVPSPVARGRYAGAANL